MITNSNTVCIANLKFSTLIHMKNFNYHQKIREVNRESLIAKKQVRFT